MIPSVKTISQIGYLDRVHTCDRAKNAKIIRKILEGKLDPNALIRKILIKE